MCACMYVFCHRDDSAFFLARDSSPGEFIRFEQNAEVHFIHFDSVMLLPREETHTCSHNSQSEIKEIHGFLCVSQTVNKDG